MSRRDMFVSARVRRGQAMIETVFAVVFLTVLFLTIFQLSQMLQSRILLDHAAARAARARAVGFNEFMCLKSARVAMIPVAGERLWPKKEDWEEADAWGEAARVPDYLASENEAHARAILEYERWLTSSIDVRSGNGAQALAEADILMETDDYRMDGHAEIESHYPFYMHDQGR